MNIRYNWVNVNRKIIMVSTLFFILLYHGKNKVINKLLMVQGIYTRKEIHNKKKLFNITCSYFIQMF